jgi:hypothetical protein
VKELSGHPRQRRYKWIAVDVFGMTPPPSEPAGDDSVSFSVTIESGETVITMWEDRDSAVIVRSDAGERIYLPPEDFDRDARANAAGSGVTPADSPYDGVGTDSPYQSAPTDSPYQSAPTDSPYQTAGTDGPDQERRDDSPYQIAESDSPYQGAESDSPYQGAGETPQGDGLSPTADGYRIRHPEPVTDVRVLR